jgi:HlyD family secretion protein
MSNDKNNEGITASKSKSFKVVGGAAIVVLVGLVALWLEVGRGSDEPTANFATFVAKRGPLTISVLESGTIKAREQIIIKNEVEGRTSIITLIPEGNRVKKGDLLVELDASTLEDTKIDQEIRVQNNEAAYINANENLAVVKNQAEADIDKAKLTLDFAKQDSNQYKEGQYPNQLAAAKNDITLAEEELTRAQETLQWSERLFKEKYISQTELQADQLTRSRATVKVELTKNDLKLLETFTYGRQTAQLESDVRQADMALERTTRKAKADIVQAEADLKAKEAEFQRQKDKLAKLVTQLGKTKILAPADGLAVYATSARTGGPGRGGSQQPLEEGQEVFERQELIYLPTTESAMVEVPIHESSLEKVRVGLPAVITVDALPGKKFLGRLAAIAPLPDARSMWMNPDLKVYNSKIYLDDTDSSLRTGMSCKAEIIVEQYDDVVYIPVQAVLRVGGEPTVYVVKDKLAEPRKVEIGLDNNRMIRIVSGIQEGEVVLLTPPLKSGTVEPTSQKVDINAPGTPGGSDTMKQRINERIQKANGAQQGGENLSSGGRAGQQSSEKPAGEERGSGQEQQQEGGTGAPPGMSSQEMEKMRQRFESMSPEERQAEMEKMKQRFQNMSPEEREKLRQQRSKGADSNSPDSGRGRRQRQGQNQDGAQ